MARLAEQRDPINTHFRKDNEGKKDFNDYLENVSKLIPSEIIAGYLIMYGFVPLIQEKETQRWAYYLIFLLCLVLTPVYLNSQNSLNKPIRIHLIICSISFMIWAFVTTGKTLLPNFYDPAIASIILIAFTLISAKIPLTKI